LLNPTPGAWTGRCPGFERLFRGADRVREQRVGRGMSQAELVAELGVSRQTVISIEGGRYAPSLPLAFRIARIFAMPVEQLFDPEQGVSGAVVLRRGPRRSQCRSRCDRGRSRRLLRHNTDNHH
jgi:putative transcriptional regulator